MVKSRLFLSLLGTLLAPVLSTAISSDVRATPVDGMLAVGRAPVLMEERLHNLRRRESPVIEDETAATIDFAEVIRSVDALFREPASPKEGSKEETEAVTTAGRITAEFLENPPQETDRFPLAQPPEEPEDKWIRMAREGYRKKDLELLLAAAETAGPNAIEGYWALWALELRLEAAPDDPLVHAEFERFLQLHAGEYLGELATVRYLKTAAEVLNLETFERHFKSLAWNRDDTELLNWLYLYRLEDALARGPVPAALRKTVKLHLRDQKATDESFRRLGDLLARVDRSWSWDRVLLALQKRQWTEAKRNLRAVPRPLLPASIATLERILEHPHDWYRKAMKKPSSVSARVGEFAILRLISYNRQEAAKFLDKIEEKLAAGRRSLLWFRLGYSAAVDRRPDAAKWFRRADKTRIPRELMADYENVLAWEARNAIFEGNLYSLLNILRGMPEEVLKREEWVYWLGRAHAVRGNHEEAKKRFATIAGNWSFYGKLACDALQRPYPKPTLREPPQEEAVERWEENAGIRRAEVFYRLHWYADGHREWNWAMRGLDDEGRASLAEYARRQGLIHRMINTSDRTKKSDFRLRYPTPLFSVIERSSEGQQLPTEWTYGLIRQESRFIPQASSSVGARGLMQLMPKTATWMAKQLGLNRYEAHRISDIEMNLILGTAYLRTLYESLDESFPLATAAYNAGPSRARIWRTTLRRPIEAAAFIESIPYFETRDYVKNVMSNTHTYALMLHGSAPNFSKMLGTIRPSPASRTHLP